MASTTARSASTMKNHADGHRSPSYQAPAARVSSSPRAEPSEASRNHFDVCAVTRRLRERRVAGDDRRIERLCQGHVHGVVRRDALAQCPRAIEEMEMGVTVKIEVAKIGNRFRCTVC
jgi:hypothetical protein